MTSIRILLITLTVIFLSSGIQCKKEEELEQELSEILECLKGTPYGEVLSKVIDKHGKQFVKAITTFLGVSNLFMQRLEEVSPKLADAYGDIVASGVGLFNDIADEFKKAGFFGKS
ncbi:hypothetical protein TNCT_273961 [Trichonephila clavata]|uniref:Uncharacterized protein n=1 Tax=Trichonephila clavata TaxID=2740835 RepID=A0A8X6LDB8_TRICU|nr:hypothetical protein TNCT_273961 [Trichonephila clavata]